MSVHEMEKKWQEFWEKEQVFSLNVETLKNKFYALDMFPYPSGDKLHIGHWYNYGLMDAWCRFQRLNGKNIFVPFGFDAFGLPAENYAIKHGIHPDLSTAQNVEHMKNQLKRMGTTFNWQYVIDTSKPDYYKWTQWLFLQLYKNDLAYKKHAPVNWCPSCNTVLANEQVKEGRCDRCETEVIRKNLKQWFFKITNYSQKLLDNLDKLDWPEKTVSMQKNWIGRSEGAEIDFYISKINKKFTVYTTRPDTLFGVTYLTLAPEHPLVQKITTMEQKSQVEEYINFTTKISEIDRLSTVREKTGVFTGAYATNPINNEQIPIWISDYVLFSYGTGAVMAVPAHDERDFAFAQKYNLVIKKIILAPNTTECDVLKNAYTEDGIIINSEKYNGMANTEMIKKIITDLELQNIAKRKINFRLRDWLISRQRFWGAPIPIIYCQTCGEVAVPENDLPVTLPLSGVDFRPTGESPLAKSEEFVQCHCPICGKNAKREVDTLDTFVCSSWYFLRFPSANRQDVPFDTELTNTILPVDKYVGGPEHACMHLIYARFITQALKDLGFINFDEPFTSLTHHGMVLGSDGQKMSKSRGNSASPDIYVEEFGSDAIRMYLAFAFKYSEGGPWNDKGIKAIVSYIDRVKRLIEDKLNIWQNTQFETKTLNDSDKKLRYAIHFALKHATIDAEKFQFNTAIARAMELTNSLYDYTRLVKSDDYNIEILQEGITILLLILAPFMPHNAEELWNLIGNKKSIFTYKYPKYNDDYLILDTIKIAIMINGKLRGEIKVSSLATEEDILAEAKKQLIVQKYIDGKEINKTIFIPKKLINLIIK